MGRYLLQHRLPLKGVRLYDASAAGHVDIGESNIEATIREAKEELNIKLLADDLTDLAVGFIVEDTYPELEFFARHVCAIYTAVLPKTWQFVASKEVDKVEFMTLEELRRLTCEYPEQCTVGLKQIVSYL